MMEMPKRRNDAALTKGARCLHAPMMGKLSNNLGSICLEVLGDYVINDLRREVTDLRRANSRDWICLLTQSLVKSTKV